MRYVLCLLAAGGLLLGGDGALRAESGGAGPGGREDLRNGAVVTWKIDPASEGSRLGLSVPAFLRWTSKGFDEPMTIRMHSNALAAIDAWELALYRVGDTGFERPIRRFRGTARTLHTPLSWSGDTEDGPALRPGETIVARLSVRDIAGNIDRAETQETMIARYMMRAERKKITALDARRARMLATGTKPSPRRIPARGYGIGLALEGWTESEAPHASGTPLDQTGGRWTLDQIVPTGSHNIVIQSTRPIIGGVRAVPVGAVPVTVPPDFPLIVGIKGTGVLERLPDTHGGYVPQGYDREGMVSGAPALTRILTEREAGEDRLAFALIDPDRPVTLVKDASQRRSLLVSHDAGTAAWPGEGQAQFSVRAPTEPMTHRITSTYAALDGPEILLPHTDITKLDLFIAGEEGLRAYRDYFPNLAEGRVLVAAPVLARLSRLPDAVLDVAYDIPTFAPSVREGGTVRDNGRSRDERWGEGDVRYTKRNREDRGLFGRLRDWLFGSDT